MLGWPLQKHFGKIFICGWKAEYSYSSLCIWHNNATTTFSNHTALKSRALSELSIPSNKLSITNGKLGLMRMESVFLLNSVFLPKHMSVLHQSTNLVMPWHQQWGVHVVSSQIHGSQDRGLSSINSNCCCTRSTSNCYNRSSHPPGAHFLLWVTLNGERQAAMGRHASCAAQRSLSHSNS